MSMGILNYSSKGGGTGHFEIRLSQSGTIQTDESYDYMVKKIFSWVYDSAPY